MTKNTGLESKIELDLEDVNALIKLGSLTQEMICVLRRKTTYHEMEVEGIHDKYLKIKPVLEKLYHLKDVIIGLYYLKDVVIGMSNIEKIYDMFKIDPSFNPSYYWCENNLKG